MNPISVANTISSSPPARPLPRPGYAYPMPSAPPLDDVFYKGIFRSPNPDYRVGNTLSIPGYVREEKKIGKGCCIIC